MKKLFFLFLLIPGLVFADWQSTLESQFDIVETFDTLQDWTGGNYAGDITTASAMPKNGDGSASMWNYYSDWAEGTKGVKWITDFGAGTRVGASGKSLRLDLNSGGDTGPSRFGAYIGTGTASSGYQSMYIFYRAYFPANYFPASGLVYEKLANFGHGFEAPMDWGGTGAVRMPYGTQSFVPQIQWSSHKLRLRSADYCGDTYPYSDEATTGVATNGAWVTFEYHFTIDDNNANSDEVEIWMYDDNGTASQVFTDNAVQLHKFSCSAGHRWNWFFIGGNKDGGSNLTYYIDDVIINDTRIGPTYFAILENGVEEDTTPPTISVDPVVAVNGTTVTIPFSETVVTTGYDDGDFNLDCGATSDIALNSISGTGSSRTFTTASTVHRGDTCNLDTGAGYSANEIEDAAGNDLVAITNRAVTNNSMANTAPTSTIDTPTENQTIGEGDTVNFTGTGADADSDDMTYAWSFDGGASNSTSADPGNVQFNNAGIYDVTFTVTDEFGLADSTPDTVQVTVEAAAPPGLPQGGIGGPGAGVGADKPQMSVGVE